MEEYSRILIGQYWWDYNSAKSRRLEKLVRKSYDINAEYTDVERLQEAFRDLVDFMFGY